MGIINLREVNISRNQVDFNDSEQLEVIDSLIERGVNVINDPQYHNTAMDTSSTYDFHQLDLFLKKFQITCIESNTESEICFG